VVDWPFQASPVENKHAQCPTCTVNSFPIPTNAARQEQQETRDQDHLLLSELSFNLSTKHQHDAQKTLQGFGFAFGSSARFYSNVIWTIGEDSTYVRTDDDGLFVSGAGWHLPGR
jgi:hypothetical protein